MLVSCLMPTFGRFPHLAYLVEEAVECFLRQTYEDRELIIYNDTPGQNIQFHHPKVRVINTNFRYATLGDKLHWMLEQAQGEYICRWDDDDLSLPWRLSYSVAKLFDADLTEWTREQPYLPPKRRPQLKEWRPENHWYDPKGGKMSETKHPGNTHIMGIWHRDLILGDQEATHSGREVAPTIYPGKACPSGLEDQTFNQHIWSLGYPRYGNLLPLEDIFYLYRWGTGSQHLSGAGGGDVMQQTYNKLANTITLGHFDIQPHWHTNHLARVKEAIARYPTC